MAKGTADRAVPWGAKRNRAAPTIGQPGPLSPVRSWENDASNRPRAGNARAEGVRSYPSRESGNDDPDEQGHPAPSHRRAAARRSGPDRWTAAGALREPPRGRGPRIPGAAARPDGQGRLSPYPQQPPQCRGRVAGHLPRRRPQGGVGHAAGDGRQPAWRNPADTTQRKDDGGEGEGQVERKGQTPGTVSSLKRTPATCSHALAPAPPRPAGTQGPPAFA